jgi:hypothetical protein
MKPKYNNIISLTRRYKNYDPEGNFLHQSQVDFALIAPYIKPEGFGVFVRAHNTMINNNLPCVPIYSNFSFMNSKNREFTICNGGFNRYSKYVKVFDFNSIYNNIL